ncbi:MAG: ribokinase [Ignavibacteriales bacterium]
MSKLLVVGSMNIDEIVITDKMPKPGQTVFGKEYKMVSGGKGANQAIAAARLGGEVDFIGCVGADLDGDFLLENFRKNNVNYKMVLRKENVLTGKAYITVCNGENQIIVISGANEHVTKEMINVDAILNSQMVLVQLEVPFETIEYVINICYEHKIPVILNPAPANKLSEDLISKVTYLTPNETEAELIFGSNDYKSLVSKYPNKLIITLGSEGAIFKDENGIQKVSTMPAKVVDTTGAGDTFNGALAVSILNNKTLLESVKFATLAATIKTTKLGAQEGMPTLEGVKKFI